VINLLGVWLMLFAILVGWGLMLIWVLRRVGGGWFSGSLSTFQTMWLGYAGLLGFLQLASLALPIAEVVLALACLPAAGGFVLQRRAVARRVRQLSMRPRVVVLLACLAFLTSTIAAYSAWDYVRLYDTGLYHLQAVKWSNAYSVVPGLANLHTRFGYNNSVHLFGAFTDVFWEGVAVHIANGFFLAMFLIHWFTEILTAKTPRGRRRQLFCMLTLPYLLAKLWTMEVASLSSDLPLAVFSFVLVLELVSLPRWSRAFTALPLALIVSLGAVIATTKLGGLSLFAVSGVFALVLARHIEGGRARVVLIALPLLIVLGWLVRGVIMSGWLVYPVFGRLPLSWAVPADVAANDLGNIKSWSRMWAKPPEEVFGHGFWFWFSPWLETFRSTKEFLLLVFSCALLAFRVANGPSRSQFRSAEWCAIGACVLAIAQWFLGAPDLRYGGYLFWLLPVVLVVPMLANAMSDATQRALVLVFSLAFITWGGGFAFHQFSLPKVWGRPPAPQHPDTTRRTSGPGTEVFVPVQGDQCWDADLPCTQSPRQRRRDPSSLGAGFLP
jgi:hypothetical protein